MSLMFCTISQIYFLVSSTNALSFWNFCLRLFGLFIIFLVIIQVKRGKIV